MTCTGSLVVFGMCDGRLVSAAMAHPVIKIKMGLGTATFCAGAVVMRAPEVGTALAAWVEHWITLECFGGT